MPVSARTTDRFMSIAIYIGIGVFILWVGSKLINYCLEVRFYKDFLLEWEVSAQSFKSDGGIWPQFSEGDRVGYMEHLTQRMSKKGMSLPASNAKRPFIYHINRLGHPKEEIFLLCLSHKIILSGISEKTLMRIDKWIDGKVDSENGLFTGIHCNDGVTYVGEMRL